MKKAAFIALTLSLTGPVAFAYPIEEVAIIGNPSVAEILPSSAQVITQEELAKFQYSDINRILRQASGVYIQEEDGFGLRPNIGIRGAIGERSSKINLMEDGILISPAPYSAPSAYYFPTSGRMSSIEILKGSETLRFGPSTVGGAVNLLSTPIPEKTSGKVSIERSQNHGLKTHANYAKTSDRIDFLIETHQQRNDGYKSIDRSSSNTGFDIEDYVGKLRIKSAKNANYEQVLSVKLQYSDELSNETYLGLTDADFKANPDRRYGLSALDNMQTEHSSANIQHSMKFNQNTKLTSTLYRNNFERDWFKVKGVTDYINSVNEHDASAADAQAILNGTKDIHGVSIKHNNREYVSQGLQFVLDTEFSNHQLEVGLRIHEDEVDRYQPEDIFNQVNGALVFDKIKDPSSSNNRVGEAEALSLHTMDVWTLSNKLSLRLGLRYENISTTQTRYSDQNRTEVDSTRENDVSELLWSIGVTYEPSDTLQLFTGAHAGFSPTSPSAQENIDPETSTNYELGLRYKADNLNASAIMFFSDFSSAVTNCTVARPCSDDQTIDAESEGQSEIYGLELMLSRTIFNHNGLTMPMSASYTFTNAQITDPEDSENSKGDLYEYLPENTFHFQAGLESQNWSSYLSASYSDQMCTEQNVCKHADQEQEFSYTDAYWVVDSTSQYHISEQLSASFKIDNLFDKRAIVSRHPDGARPNLPRTVSVGINYQF